MAVPLREGGGECTSIPVQQLCSFYNLIKLINDYRCIVMPTLPSKFEENLRKQTFMELRYVGRRQYKSHIICRGEGALAEMYTKNV